MCKRWTKCPLRRAAPAKEKDAQETSCSQDAAGSQRDIGDATFHDAQANGSGPLWCGENEEDNLEAMDVPTVGAAQQVDAVA